MPNRPVADGHLGHLAQGGKVVAELPQSAGIEQPDPVFPVGQELPVPEVLDRRIETNRPEFAAAAPVDQDMPVGLDHQVALPVLDQFANRQGGILRRFEA